MRREVISESEKETEDLGRELARDLSGSDVVYLMGDLGSGKTTLARGLATGLGAVVRDVASPTFAILHEYSGPGGAISMRHLDLYRLADRESELEVLGLPDAVAGAPVAVEWPGRAIRSALPPTYEVTIEEQPGGSRRIEILRSPRECGGTQEPPPTDTPTHS
ncbi:MAG TPA: tRNA (adenosine(37)-N6)-threonylcarbamoyltransferase complex ATPase subunit type 1 TsaE [Thermoanaerobaculia bacterium]|jgi:tRNA threonylcarbamoyladenosine biosynthesis protein TsaE